MECIFPKCTITAWKRGVVKIRRVGRNANRENDKYRYASVQVRMRCGEKEMVGERAAGGAIMIGAVRFKMLRYQPYLLSVMQIQRDRYQPTLASHSMDTTASRESDEPTRFGTVC